MGVAGHPQPNLPTGLMTHTASILPPGVCQDLFVPIVHLTTVSHSH